MVRKRDSGPAPVHSVQIVKHPLYELFTVGAFASGGFTLGTIHAVSELMNLD